MHQRVRKKEETRKTAVRQQSSELTNTLLADAAMIEVDNQ